MILVLDDEVRPKYRYLGPEIAHFIDESEYHVYAEDRDHPPIEDYDGIVISGSTASVYEEGYPWFEAQMELVKKCLDHQVPLLGVCFGHQLINFALGGEVIEDRRRATFVEMTTVESTDPVLEGIESIVPVLHSDLVVEPGAEMEVIAETDYNEHFCTRHTKAPIWTVQFHPEFTERVREQPSDWSDGEYSFEECNATRVLENFEVYCHR
ncbi:type 1 glutamine amidotransferase [Natronorubrum aibiense]|uniref:Glutamine amidotransferase n=1 Tax=Natronorubrum aibiense TaxID=348826 RepID=A0A5P9P9G9_9EURY|nr:type 1 glutamine amidotransferase [Natronorubrum aibiense]QFU84530.1 glutamine amidotransferase [Natronorubrum aibiense]